MVKITIFGLAGTGTSSVAKELAQRENLKFLSSGNIFREMAAERGMSLAEFGELCSKDETIDKELDKRIEKYGKDNDDLVVDSRLAWYFIPDSLKVKLECADDERYRRVSERDNVDVEEAKEKTDERENSERTRYLNYYGIEDFSDKTHFDLVIDTTNIDIEEVCDKIEEFIQK